MKTCAFFGHRKVFSFYEIENKLINTVEKLIEEGCVRFLVGDHGEFDNLALNVCLKLKKKFSNIKIEKVATSLNFNKPKDEECCVAEYDTIIYDIETVYFKRRIETSNRHVIDESDVVVCYIRDKEYCNGAVNAVKYADKSGEKIINILNI